MTDTVPDLPPSTLVDILRARARDQPDDVAYSFLDSDGATPSLTYAELASRVHAVATGLRGHAQPGERALLLYPPGLDFVVALFGCMAAGLVAVPAYPPRANRSLDRLNAIVTDAGATLALTTERLSARAAAVRRLDGQLTVLTTETWRSGGADGSSTPSAADAALLQYTSGSTGAPRGVLLTHDNLMRNSAHIGRSFGTGPDSRAVVWLPVYHDMGLIGGVIQPLFAGFPVTLMSPTSFLQSPYRWLKTISDTRADISGGPNFAFDLAVRRVTPEQREQLDLGSWRVAFNGAEPVRARTLRRFAEHFAPCGFRPETLTPCYGLAEATLLVTSARVESVPVEVAFDRSALLAGRAVPADGPAGQSLVGCGRPGTDPTVRIVDPDTGQRCAPGTVGEVWIAGTAVAAGYWHRPDDPAFGARTADGETGFHRTGDLGFLHDGELFVTGRRKDLVIIRGRNHHPQDIEASVQSAHPALRPDAGAAFSVERGDEERLVVVNEVDRGLRGATPAEVAAAVRRAISEEHELRVDAVVLLRPGSLPRTTSGKVRRGACREGYLTGTLDEVARDALAQDDGSVSGPAAPVVPPVPDDLRAAAPDDRRRLLTGFLSSCAAEVLGIRPGDLPQDRPLTESGLDSLTAVRLQHRLETDLRLPPPLELLLDGASAADLAGWFVDALGAEPERAAGPAAGGDEEGPTGPLALGQGAMWFLHRMAPDSPAYNMASALRITAEVDPVVVERSFAALLDRHDILRTTYETSDNEPVQRVGPAGQGWFRRRDVAGWDDDTLRTALVEASEQPFDLENGPVVRVDLFSRGAADHFLLLTIHHVAADFWSIELLLDEFGELYRTGGRSAAPAPAFTYREYARWQRGLLAGPEGERLWSHWRRALAGEPPVLQLPTDRPRPPVRTYAGGTQRFTLDRATAASLSDLARANGTTLYTVLLASYLVFLHRYSGQTDVVVGSPIAGRGHARLAGLVGHLANTVPMRVDLSGDPTFTDLVGRARQTVVQALAHQDFPFAAMVERLGVARDPAFAPLFQHMFTFQQTHLSGSSELAALAFAETALSGRIGDLPVESVVLPRRAAQFDLSLQMAESQLGIAVSLTYNTDLFDAATAARMAAHFRTLLIAVGTQAGRRISDLPLVETDAAPRRAPSGDLHHPHRLITDQAARTPDAIALVDEAGATTYAELDRAAERLAAHLRRRGPRGRVGIVLEPGARQIVAMLAAMKANAAYVPADPGYPSERIEFILTDARVEVVVTQRALRDVVAVAGVDVLYLDDADDLKASGADEERHRAPSSLDDPAAVLYTSGSTGRPKGVVLTHRGLATQVRALREVTGLGPGDRQILAQSLAFAASIRQILVPLSCGATVVLAGAALVADPVALFDFVKRQQVTVMSVNPSYWRHCADMLRRLPAQERDALLDNRLRLLMSASEPLPPEVPRWWLATLGSRVRFVNMLGHTELSGIAATYELPADLDTRAGTVSVGGPLRGVEVHVLNESLRPVPPGVPGELYLGGPALMQGYLGRPDLTADALRPDPFGPPGGRLYRTCDLVRISPGGQLEHLGRVDDQLKVRGFRIEPREVQAVLERHALVRTSVVVTRPTPGGDSRLVAYFVPEALPAPSTSELRRHLSKELPGYLVPSVFVPLDAFPLNANGKLDRLSLPDPGETRPELDGGYVAPTTPLEHTLAGIWAELLEVDRVGVHDSFFDLGGTSLSLTVAHRLLCQRLEVELPIVKLFQYPTVRALAGFLQEAGAGVPEQVERERAAAARRRQRLDGIRSRRRGDAS